MNRRLRGQGATATVEVDRDAVSAEIVHHLQRTLDDVAEGRFGSTGVAETGWSRVGNYSHTGERVKDALDRVLAAIALVAASPVLLATALAVRLDSPGPALFRQTRIGCDGRPFHIWKFRSMYADARRRFPERYGQLSGAWPEHGPGLRAQPDPRITGAGRFLRRTHLDELPSLVNVVLGEMSLVGPRPEIPDLVPYFGASAKLILSVKPGVWSLAGLLGRAHATFEETLELDLRYVRERSLRMDLGILAGTLWKAITSAA